jgi:hypothetical protein
MRFKGLNTQQQNRCGWLLQAVKRQFLIDLAGASVISD